MGTGMRNGYSDERQLYDILKCEGRYMWGKTGENSKVIVLFSYLYIYMVDSIYGWTECCWSENEVWGLWMKRLHWIWNKRLKFTPWSILMYDNVGNNRVNDY